MSVVNYSGMIRDTVSNHVLVTVQQLQVELTTGKNAKEAYLYVYLHVYQYQQLHISMLNYLSTLIVFFCKTIFICVYE